MGAVGLRIARSIPRGESIEPTLVKSGPGLDSLLYRCGDTPGSLIGPSRSVRDRTLRACAHQRGKRHSAVRQGLSSGPTPMVRDARERCRQRPASRQLRHTVHDFAGPKALGPLDVRREPLRFINCGRPRPGHVRRARGTAKRRHRRAGCPSLPSSKAIYERRNSQRRAVDVQPRDWCVGAVAPPVPEQTRAWRRVREYVRAVRDHAPYNRAHSQSRGDRAR
jgi:hypothetical protein